MGKYKNIFIDLDDTIYDFAAASRESFEEVYTMLGYERFFNSFNHFLSLYEPHNLELWALYGEGKITKAQLNSDRYRIYFSAGQCADCLGYLSQPGSSFRYSRHHA